VHLTPEQYVKNELNSEVPILDWRRFAKAAHLRPVPDDPCKEDYGFKTHVGCDDACQGNFRDWLRTEAPEMLDRSRKRFSEDGPRDLLISPYPSEYHQSSFIAEKTVQYIRQRNPNEPWMAFCSFVAPHHPFEAPKDQIHRYDERDIPPPDIGEGVQIENPPEDLAAAIGEIETFPEKIQRRIVLHYYAAVSLIDDCVGRVLDALEESGQAEETVVVFVADHGEFLGNHGLLRKPSFHYDDTLRVPLLLRAPGLEGGRRVGGLVELIDLYPTLLGLLDLPVNAGVQGMDLSTALAEGKPIGRPDIHSDIYDMDPMVCGEGSGPYAACQTLRTEEWKVNVYPDDHPECGQLFHLGEDPGETRNLYNDPGHREKREEMLWRLLQRMHSNTDPLPLRLTQW
jgi:arylsulfatase A-like enzyme